MHKRGNGISSYTPDPLNAQPQKSVNFRNEHAQGFKKASYIKEVCMVRIGWGKNKMRF